MVKALSWRLIWILGLGLKRRKKPLSGAKQHHTHLCPRLCWRKSTDLRSDRSAVCLRLGRSDCRTERLSASAGAGICPAQGSVPKPCSYPPAPLSSLSGGEGSPAPPAFLQHCWECYQKKKWKENLGFAHTFISELIPFKSLKVKYFFFGKSLGRFAKLRCFYFWGL